MNGQIARLTPGARTGKRVPVSRPLRQLEAGGSRSIQSSRDNCAGPLSGGSQGIGKAIARELARFGITVNCIHPGITRTERTPRLLAARAAEVGITPEEAEQRTYAPDSPRGNTICRMVDAAEIAYVAAFLASQPSAASWSWRQAPEGRCITGAKCRRVAALREVLYPRHGKIDVATRARTAPHGRSSRSRAATPAPARAASCPRVPSAAACRD